MTSLQVIIGCAWLPTLIALIFVGYLYWQHRKYTRHNSRMPDICDQLNDKEGDNRT